MINFNIAGVVVDDTATNLRGLSDIKIVNVAGRFVLVVASEADGALTTFSLNGTGAPTLVDVQKYSGGSGTGRVSSLGFVQAGGETVLLPATRYEDQTAFYTLGSGGALSRAGNSGVSGEGIGLNEAVVIGSDTFVYVQSYGGQTLTVYRMGDAQRLVQVQALTDTDSSFLGDISALEHLEIGGKTFLFVASAFDAGLSVYQIGSEGRLSLRDTVEPGDRSGFARAQGLVAFEVEGQAYVVLAAAGTSSLTVYAVADNGGLSEVAHLIDTLETRFQGATLVEAFDFGGRQFLVTAGSDDGITVLEVLAGGALRVEASLADTYDITLDNVSAIAVEIFNGVPVLFVSSATDHGFTRIELDIAAPPEAIEGTAGDDTLIGTGGDDIIRGLAGNDTIKGGGGDDTLVDGAGRDVLDGSQGVDTFTFVKDGEVDVIADFNPDWDLIDLSAFGGVSSFADLRIVKGCEGIMIYVDGEFIVLEVERHRLEIDDLTAAHFIF